MQLVTNPKLGAFRNLVPVSPGSIDNPYCSTSLCREVQLYICIPRYDIAVCIEVYCRVDQNGTGASGPRGGCARDFVNFRGKHEIMHRAYAARARGFDSLPSPRSGLGMLRYLVLSHAIENQNSDFVTPYSSICYMA